MSDELELFDVDERLQLIEANNLMYLDMTTPGLATLPHTTVSLAAGDTIPSGYNVVYAAGAAGDVMLTSAPTIAAGIQNQPLWIIGTDDAAVVRLQDVTNHAGSTLHLQYSRDVYLGLNDVLQLMYTGSAWVQTGGSDNA